jgi:hypothetical protein
MLAVEKKFGLEIEPLYLASLLEKIEVFDNLPVVMIKPLTLKTLKNFFRKCAIDMAGKMVKE